LGQGLLPLLHSFLAPPSPFASTTTTTASNTRLESTSKKINHKIDTDSTKVVHQQSLELGEKKVYCRCWKSETFPYCDGAHVMHNKETGDNVGPVIVVTEKLVEASSTKKKEEEEERAVTTQEEGSSTLGRKIKKFLGLDNQKVGDGLTTRERLAKMGLSALLSYGWVSNMSYAVTLSLSWYGFSKKVSRAG
jgi:CDGSH-type Zn-finger protein